MIVYAPRALRDLRAIEAYIQQFNSAAAQRVTAAIKRTIHSFPNTLKDEAGHRRINVRRYPRSSTPRCGFDSAHPAHRTKTRLRLPIGKEIEERIARIAKKNRSRSHDRIVGAVANLGYQVSDQTVGNFCDAAAYRGRRSAGERPRGQNSFELGN